MCKWNGFSVALLRFTRYNKSMQKYEQSQLVHESHLNKLSACINFWPYFSRRLEYFLKFFAQCENTTLIVSCQPFLSIYFHFDMSSNEIHENHSNLSIMQSSYPCRNCDRQNGWLSIRPELSFLR